MPDANPAAGQARFCAHCGAEIPSPDAAFCPNCGKPVVHARGGPAAAPSPASQVASPPPPQVAAAPAPRKGMKLWKKIVIGVAAFLVLVIGLAIWATAPLVEPIEAHLALLKQGKVTEAYEQTASEFRKATSREQFADFVRSNPILTQVADYSFPEKKWENDTGEVRGTLTAADGTAVPVFYRLFYEQEEWRIISIELNPGK